MAIKAQKTKLIIDGEDASSLVHRLELHRYPVQGGAETVLVELTVERLAVSEDGTLEVHIELPEPEWVKGF